MAQAVAKFFACAVIYTTRHGHYVVNRGNLVNGTSKMKNIELSERILPKVVWSVLYFSLTGFVLFANCPL